MNKTPTETPVKFTTIQTTTPFAKMVTELAKDAGILVRDFVDREFLKSIRKKYALMLDRKRAELGGES